MNQKTIAALEEIIHSRYSNTAGMIVLKNGETQYESYFNGCTADSCINIFSVTKSIISILIGIAVDRGEIQSVNQKVLDFFPDFPNRARCCPVRKPLPNQQGQPSAQKH